MAGALHTSVAAWLGERCSEQVFRDFLQARFRVVVPDEPAAADLVRAICKVKSRADIDRDPAATLIFHQQIRIPYAAHLEFAPGMQRATTTQL